MGKLETSPHCGGLAGMEMLVREIHPSAPVDQLTSIRSFLLFRSASCSLCLLDLRIGIFLRIFCLSFSFLLRSALLLTRGHCSLWLLSLTDPHLFIVSCTLTFCSKLYALSLSLSKGFQTPFLCFQSNLLFFSLSVLPYVCSPC